MPKNVTKITVYTCKQINIIPQNNSRRLHQFWAQRRNSLSSLFARFPENFNGLGTSGLGIERVYKAV